MMTFGVPALAGWSGVPLDRTACSLAKAPASRTHSKRFATKHTRAVKLALAFGVRPACRRFRSRLATHGSLDIHWSLVIGHWSLVIGHLLTAVHRSASFGF